MKTDREFLDGIYAKAELLNQNEIDAITPKVIKLNHTKSFVLKGVAAAAVVLIAIPAIGYINQPKMEIPKEAQNAPMAMKAMLAPDAKMLYSDADVVLTGKITKIEKSVYDEDKGRIITSVKLNQTKILKGNVLEETINININGGKTDKYEPYEAVFKRHEDVLVFLKPDTDNISYILSEGEFSKFTRTDIADIEDTSEKSDGGTSKSEGNSQKETGNALPQDYKDCYIDKNGITISMTELNELKETEN